MILTFPLNIYLVIQAWWCMLVIPALGSLRHGDHEFEASLGYIANTRQPELLRTTPCLNKIYVCTCVCIYMCVCVSVCVCVYIHIHVCLCVCVHIYSLFPNVTFLPWHFWSCSLLVYFPSFWFLSTLQDWTRLMCLWNLLDLLSTWVLISPQVLRSLFAWQSHSLTL
jgi:hypothetical protein